MAPANLEFLASDWSELGTKRSLLNGLSKITGIRPEILVSDRWLAMPSHVSAAEKMSWAADRNTTFRLLPRSVLGEGVKCFDLFV